MSTVEPENPNGLGEPDRSASEFGSSASGLGRDAGEFGGNASNFGRSAGESGRSANDFGRGSGEFGRAAGESGYRLDESVGSIPEDDVRLSPEPMPASAGRRPGTRIPDPTSIAAGVVFFLLGGAYLLAASGHLTVNAAWTISLLFIGLGLSGVLGAALHDRGRRPGRGPRG